MERSPEIEKLVSAWFDAASRGDPSLIDQRVSQDERTLLVGTDPDEWFPGRAAAEYLRGQIDASGGIQRTLDEVHAFAEGTVGWAVTRFTIAFPDGRSASPRWSAVFHQEDGDWRIVHLHASIGVSNEASGWVSR
jgi:adenylate cyclase